MTDSEPPQASAAPDRVLWFYRALHVRRKATVFVSAAPAEPDVPLWLRAVERVAAQRARWCEGAECGGVSAFVGVDEHGGPVVSVVASVAGHDVRLTRSTANEPFVAGALRLVTKRASTKPIGSLGEAFWDARPVDAPPVDTPPADAPPVDTPPADAPEAEPTPGAHAARLTAELRRVGETLKEDAPCIPCRAVWCAWCRGGEVVAAGRAYGGEPEPLDFPGLAFALRLQTMALLPTDAEDAAAIRAGLDRAVGPGVWCGQKIVDEEDVAVPPLPEPFDTAEPFACLWCLDDVCHAHARAINVALPSSRAPRESAAARALVEILCSAAPDEQEAKRPRREEAEQ